MNLSEINQKIIDKIKKLLELTTSPNEAEAKLAMEQAQKLMLKYSIDYLALNKNEPTAQIETCEYSTDVFLRQGVLNATPSILAIIPPIFGVYAVVSSIGKSIESFKLYGFPANLEIAKFALDSVFAQGLIMARAEYKKYRTTTFGMSFWSGFALGLQIKFGKIATSDQTALAVYDPVKKFLDDLTKGETFGGRDIDGVAYQTGIRSGQSVELRKGIGDAGNQGKLLQ